MRKSCSSALPNELHLWSSPSLSRRGYKVCRHVGVVWVGLRMRTILSMEFRFSRRYSVRWLVFLYSFLFVSCLRWQREHWTPASAHSYCGRCPAPLLLATRSSPLIQPASSSPHREPTLPATHWSRPSPATLMSSSRAQCLSIPVQQTPLLQVLYQNSLSLSPVQMKRWVSALMNLVSSSTVLYFIRIYYQYNYVFLQILWLLQVDSCLRLLCMEHWEVDSVC